MAIQDRIAQFMEKHQGDQNIRARIEQRISARNPQQAQQTTQPYAYSGHGWDDPLAQQAYANVNGSKMMGMLKSSPYAVAPGAKGYTSNFLTPLDPSKWGTNYHGDQYDKLKQEYLNLGGMGTYEQLSKVANLAAFQPSKFGSIKTQF